MESKRFWRVNEVTKSWVISNPVSNMIVCRLNEEPVVAAALAPWEKAVRPFSCRRSAAVLQSKEVRHARL